MIEKINKETLKKAVDIANKEQKKVSETTGQDKKILLAIEGYNEEKKILSTELRMIPSGNLNIPRRSSIEWRLRQIDECIAKLINKIERN